MSLKHALGVLESIHTLGWAVAIGGTALCVGATELWSSLDDLGPVRTTCAEYDRNRPGAEWLILEACRLSLPEATIEGPPYGSIERASIPIRPIDRADPRSLLSLSTEDKALLHVIEELSHVAFSASAADNVRLLVERDPKLRAFYEKNGRDVERQAREAEAAYQRFLRERDAELHPVMTIEGVFDGAALIHGETPRIGWPLALVVVGSAIFFPACLVLIGMIAGLQKRRASSSSP